MKANSDKSHFIMTCAEATTAMIDGLPNDSNKAEVLLRISDHELKFDNHVKNLCKKASLKHNALAKSELSWSHLFNHSLGSVLWYGCFIVEDSIIKETLSMKEL